MQIFDDEGSPEALTFLIIIPKTNSNGISNTTTRIYGHLSMYIHGVYYSFWHHKNKAA